MVQKLFTPLILMVHSYILTVHSYILTVRNAHVHYSPKCTQYVPKPPIPPNGIF